MPTEDTPELRIDVIWTDPQELDLVALVPARQYDVNGVVLDYGLPDSFSVEVIGADGKAVPIASERGIRSSTVRSGYPFVYPLETPVIATGLRINALSLIREESEAEGQYVMAMSEILCFSNGRNVAHGARVETPHEPIQPLHWKWQSCFAVDGQTSLGLPELPSPPNNAIGWLSRDRARADDLVWIVIDLGESRHFEGMRLYPARRPSLGNIPGFGMPRRFTIGVSGSGVPATYSMVWKHIDHDMENSGHNPLEVRFRPTKARFVRLEVTKLWKSFESYPAFLALSEIEVLNCNTNIALGAKVVSSDQTGPYVAHENLFWSESCLTDGRGPQGVLVNPVDWFMGLDRRRS